MPGTVIAEIRSSRVRQHATAFGISVLVMVCTDVFHEAYVPCAEQHSGANTVFVLRMF